MKNESGKGRVRAMDGAGRQGTFVFSPNSLKIPSAGSSPTPISVENLLGADLQKLWADSQSAGFCQRQFMAPKHLHPGSLLFVGINPAYSEADEALRVAWLMPPKEPA